MNTLLLSALAFVSVLTSLTVEALKKVLDEWGKTYKSNLLAGIVAIVLSVCATIVYVVLYKIPVSAQTIVLTICFAFFSWLCSMVGFDKVKQLIDQFTKE